MASKTLNFYSYDLRHDTTVMPMFKPPNSQKLFIDQYPVVWKVITFRARGHGKASVKYVNRLGFGYAQTDEDNLVGAAAWVEVRSGDVTRVIGGPNEKRFGDTTKREDTKLLFAPVITAFVTRQYQTSQLLRGAVETDAIWECNLNELDHVTGWNFVEDSASGAFTIERAGGV